MNLLARVDGALGYLFVRCSGLGFLDDPATRRYKASLLVATWIMTAAFSLISFFSFWIYNLHDIYHALWPFRNYGHKIAGLGVLILLGGPALVIALSIGKKYASYARPGAAGMQSLVIAAGYMLVVMSLLANINRYGSIAALMLHAAFFSWLIYDERRYPLIPAGKTKSS